MKLTALMILGFACLVTVSNSHNCYGQTRRPAAPRAPTSNPTAQSPTSEMPVVQDRPANGLTEADRVHLQMKLLTAEIKAQVFALDSKGNPDAKEGTAEITEVYEKAARDGKLADILISRAIDQYYEVRANAKSAIQVSQAVDEASVRLLLLQAAQNQVLIEQNKKIIQLLNQLTKSRK